MNFSRKRLARKSCYNEKNINYSKPNLIYNSKHGFHKFHRGSKKLNTLSLKWKYSFLVESFSNLNKFKNLKTIKQKTEKKKNMYIISSKLYNFLENYYNEYNNLSDVKKRKSSYSYGPKNLFLKGHDNSVLSEDKEE